MARSFFCFLILLIIENAIGQESIQKQPIMHFHTDSYARFASFKPEGLNKLGVVHEILRDRHGFLWLASENGLGRFDGFELTLFGKHLEKSTQIGTNIQDISLNEQDELWLVSENGIYFYNYLEDNFIKHNTLKISINDTTQSSYRSLLFNESILWVNRMDGVLEKHDLKNRTVKHINYNKKNLQPYYKYHHMYADENGSLYFGDRGVGPYVYSDQMIEPELLHVNPADEKSKREEDVSVIHPFDSTHLWIGGLDGLYLFNKKSSAFLKFLSGTVYDLLTDQNGNFWAGTSKGLFHFNRNGIKAIRYIQSSDDAGSLGGMKIYSLAEDKNGTIWIAHENGVSVHKPQIKGVDYLFHIPGNNESLPSSGIGSLAINGDSLWIGTADGNLSLMDLKTKTICNIGIQELRLQLPAPIRRLKVDNGGNLYIGFWAGIGFGILKNGENEAELFRYDKLHYTQDWYNDFAFENNQSLLCGFWGGPGLTRFNLKTQGFEEVLAPRLIDSYNARLTTRLLKDANGRIWVGTTQSGLQMSEDQCISFKRITVPGHDETFFPTHISDITAVNDSTLLVLSKEGVFRTNPSNSHLIQIPLDSQNPFRRYYTALSAGSSAWLLSSDGLQKLNLKNMHLDDFSMYVNTRFKPDQATAVRWNEKLIVGGTSGIAIISPNELGSNIMFPGLFPNQLISNNEILCSGLYQREEIVIPWNKNFFSISLGSNQWDHWSQFDIYYQLTGFDPDWIKIPSGQGRIYFSNVPSGKYIFRLKITDKYGNTSLETKTLGISITTPWWRSWWFNSLLFFVITGVIIFFWRFNNKQLHLKIQNIELNNKLLRVQMNPHFIFNSLSSIQHFIYANQPQLAGEQLSDFARLIRLILENSRHETISLVKETETIQLYIGLQQMRFPHGFDFVLEVDSTLNKQQTFVPPMLAQPFLENAIEHGIKQIERKGKITLRFIRQNNRIRIEVEDNGIGMKAANHLKTNSEHPHESLSIKICRERLSILEKKHKMDLLFQLNESPNPDVYTGTQISFEIPLIINSGNNG